MSATVAIVEDDEAIRNMYATKLELAGFKVISAKDGLSGYDLVKQHQPDLILLDLKMPRLPGNEMLKKVRAEEWGSTIKVIILTNTSKHEAPFELRLLNVNDYITKVHTTPSQVVQIVKDTLKV